MSFRIQHALLVGAGALGSRHLQSLAADAHIKHVDVIEPNEDAHCVALARWGEIAGSASKTLRFCKLGELKRTPDAAIIATPSKGRLAILEDVLGTGTKYVLCEKVLFQTEAELRAAVTIVAQAGADVRVNHVYRYAPPFDELGGRLIKHQINLDIMVGGPGMGSNLIHFLDLFGFLSRAEIAALSVELDRPLLASKRGPAYAEFTGSATARTTRGDRLSVRYGRDSVPSSPRMTIAIGAARIVIDEGAGTVLANDGELRTNRFTSPRVSSLTARILRKMVEGTCPLPRIHDSESANLMMLKELNVAIHGKHSPATVCPIT